MTCCYFFKWVVYVVDKVEDLQEQLEKARYERDMIWYEMSTKGGGGGDEEAEEEDGKKKKDKKKKKKKKKKKSEDPVLGAVQKRGRSGYGNLDPDYKV